MAKTRRYFSREFKQGSVDQVEAADNTKAQIARNLGISQSLLRKWCRDGVPSVKVIHPYMENTKINSENHEVRASESELRMAEKLERALYENRALKAVVSALLDFERSVS